MSVALVASIPPHTPIEVCIGRRTIPRPPVHQWLSAVARSQHIICIERRTGEIHIDQILLWVRVRQGSVLVPLRIAVTFALVLRAREARTGKAASPTAGKRA